MIFYQFIALIFLSIDVLSKQLSIFQNIFIKINVIFVKNDSFEKIMILIYTIVI